MKQDKYFNAIHCLNIHQASEKTDEKKEKKRKKIQKEEKRGKCFLTIVAKGRGVGDIIASYPI